MPGTRQRADPHVCTSCHRSFVYPEFGVAEGAGWRVLVRCLSCGWSGETILDEQALESFERELDDERAQLERDLERLTQENMREYCFRFAAALAADAVLPEDF
jgi:hypothetical protein